MSRILRYLPELDGDEQLHVAQLMRDMTEEQAEQFAHVYRQRRRDPTMILLTALLGFAGFAGIHRFLLGQTAMGILFFLTGGLCLIGTIVDMVNHRRLTYRYNEKQAEDVAFLVQQALPPSRSPDQLPG